MRSLSHTTIYLLLHVFDPHQRWLQSVATERLM